MLLGLSRIAACNSSSTPSSLTATVGTTGIFSMVSSLCTSIDSPVFVARSCIFSAATTLYPDSISSKRRTRFRSSLVASMTSITTSALWSYSMSVETRSSSVFPAREYDPGRSTTSMVMPTKLALPSLYSTVVPG